MAQRESLWKIKCWSFFNLYRNLLLKNSVLWQNSFNILFS